MPRARARTPGAAAPAARHTLQFDGFHFATLNQLLRNRWRAARLKNVDKQAVFYQARIQGVPPAAGMRRVTLRVTLAKGQRSPDVDAFWKSVLDSLVYAKLLVDDNRQGVVLAPVEFARGETMATTIILEDVTETPGDGGPRADDDGR